MGGIAPFFLTIERQDLSGADLWIHGEIVLSGQIVNVGKNFRLSCEVSSRAILECSRCLTAYEAPVRFDFETDLEVAPLQSDGVDISSYIREELIFQEPMKPLCHNDCRGICPHCGIDLNQGDCACGRNLIDPRLAGLQKLLKA